MASCKMPVIDISCVVLAWLSRLNGRGQAAEVWGDPGEQGEPLRHCLRLSGQAAVHAVRLLHIVHLGTHSY